MTPGDANTVIEIQDLVTHYGPRRSSRASRSTSTTGEIMVVMGGSGSGKSTLLRHMLALETLTSGSIRILGQDTATASTRELQDLCAASWASPSRVARCSVR